VLRARWVPRVLLAVCQAFLSFLNHSRIDDLLQKRHYQMRRISSASIKNASLPEQKNGRATSFSTLKFFCSKITLYEKTDAMLNEDGRNKIRNQGFERTE
jgi:hypothetical protein